MANISLIIAGGSGNRMHQDIPKQFITVNEKPIIVYTLEAFVEKIEKYFIGSSLPLLKNKKNKNDKSKEKKENKYFTINNDFNNMNEEIILQKKLKQNNIIISNNKQKLVDTKLKLSNNSENKIRICENKKSNIYNNNNTFNKYKAAIMALKD